MALVHRPAATTGAAAPFPQDSLKQALAEFRAALPASEQQELDTIQRNGPFDDRNIIKLTSQIDAKTKTRFSRKLAPRLMPFLECIDAFSGAIETFVSSNPQTAALVWGSIKVLLMFACNFGEYFEKLTDVLQATGATAPKFKEYGTLFNSSQGLQDALTNYYTIVVRLCRKAVEVFQRHGLIQAAKTAMKPFEKEFEPELKDLQDKRRGFGEQVDLAKSRLQVEEAKFNEMERVYNNSFRREIKKFSSRTRQQLEDLHRWQLESRQRRLKIDREKVLENLSDIDPSIAWRRIMRQCIPDTCTWFQKNKKFLDWIADDNSAVACNVANLGRGKTVTFANVVEYLILKEGSRSSVAYIVCQSEDSRTLDPRNILGCLCRQLLQPVVTVAEGDELESLLLASRKVELEDLVALITRHPPLNTAYLLLDGIDELSSDDAVALLEALRDLYERLTPGANVKVFINYRPDRSTDFTSILTPKYIIETPLGGCEVDMMEFIKLTLVEKIDTGKLLLDNADTNLVIQNAVEEGAKGMFLWAKLFIEYLCQFEGDLAIFDALEGGNVPKELAEIYDRIILRLDARHSQREDIRNAFMWAAGATRPLTAAEMQEAITIRKGQTSLSPLARQQKIERIISRCGGLLVLEHDENTIHLVHSSLKDHLLQSNDNENENATENAVSRVLFKHNATTLDSELFVFCAIYLEFSDFNRSVTRYNPQKLQFNVTDLSRTGTNSTSNIARTAAKARQLLNRPRRLGCADNREAYDHVFQRLRELASSNATSQKNLAFIEYAKYAWVSHSQYLYASEDVHLRNLFKGLVKSKEKHIIKPWEEDNSEQSFGPDSGLSTLNQPSLFKSLDVLHVPDENRSLFLWMFRNGNPNFSVLFEGPASAVLDLLTYNFEEEDSAKVLEVLNAFSRIVNIGPQKSSFRMKFVLKWTLTDLWLPWPKSDIHVIQSYLSVLWDTGPDPVALPFPNELLLRHVPQIIELQDSPCWPGRQRISRILQTQPLGQPLRSTGEWSTYCYDYRKCSHIELAIVCNRKAYFSKGFRDSMKQLAKLIPLENAILNPFHCLELTVLFCQEDMFHEIFEVFSELGVSPAFQIKLKLVLWAIEQHMPKMVVRLLEYPIEEMATDKSDDAAHSLIWEAVRSMNVEVFAAAVKTIQYDSGRQSKWAGIFESRPYIPPGLDTETGHGLQSLQRLISESSNNGSGNKDDLFDEIWAIEKLTDNFNMSQRSSEA